MSFNKSDLELAGCLRRLLKSRFLLRSRGEKWFQAVIDLRKELQSALDAMGVRLEVDESLGVAYLKPSGEEFEEALAYQLGRKKTLSPLASALIFKLRHARLQFYLNPSSDAAPLISSEEMREFLQNFNSTRIDREFERNYRKTLEELAELQIIIETKIESGTYEISALCEVLLPLDQIQTSRAQMEKYFAHFANQSSDQALTMPSGQEVE